MNISATNKLFLWIIVLNGSAILHGMAKKKIKPIQYDSAYDHGNDRRINEKGWTLMHQALYDGDAQKVKELWNQREFTLADYNGIRPSKACNFERISRGDTEYEKKFHTAYAIVAAHFYQHCLARTLNISLWPQGQYVLKDGSTPLHAAVSYEDPDMVKRLLSYGALIVRDNEGYLPHEVESLMPPPHRNKEKFINAVRLVMQKGGFAATKIQAVVRGFLAKKHMQKRLLTEKISIIYPTIRIEK